MWDEQKSLRLRRLRQHHQNGGLTESEQGELARLIQELEAEEATYLTPASDRLRLEREAVEAQNRTLEALARRKEALVDRLRTVLAEVQAEQQAIESEVAAALAGSRGSGTDA
jgi:hypothetical protein